MSNLLGEITERKEIVGNGFVLIQDPNFEAISFNFPQCPLIRIQHRLEDKGFTRPPWERGRWSWRSKLSNESRAAAWELLQCLMREQAIFHGKRLVNPAKQAPKHTLAAPPPKDPAPKETPPRGESNAPLKVGRNQVIEILKAENFRLVCEGWYIVFHFDKRLGHRTTRVLEWNGFQGHNRVWKRMLAFTGGAKTKAITLKVLKWLGVEVDEETRQKLMAVVPDLDSLRQWRQ